jgi:hypothetical protein
MNVVNIENFDKKISIQRFLGTIKGSENSPSVIVIGGIHGNESAGVYALHKVIEEIEEEAIKFKGNFYALSGNLNSLKKKVRFDDIDLNRIWTHEDIDYLKLSGSKFNTEIDEQIALYDILKDILSKDKGPFYFIDLHTTSSETKPFITISDSLNNRKFSSGFSLPIVLGIEEFLDGPLLTYINEFGHVALGFEGGEHEDPKSIDNCEAFIWLSLVRSGCISKKEIKNLSFYEHILSEYTKITDFYEIDYRYLVQKSEDFKMLNGFKNFEEIRKGQILALSNNKEVIATMDGLIFMPLYQSQGKEGFFIVTKISKFWLGLSAIVRKLKMYHVLRLLPGIKKDSLNDHILIVDPKTAKFLATEIFHLFGYRKQVVKDDKMHFMRRDRSVTEFK